MKKETTIVLILLILLVLVTIWFPFPKTPKIQTDISNTDIACKYFSPDIPENLKDVKKQINLCETKCGEIGLTLSSSRCRESQLDCICGS